MKNILRNSLLVSVVLVLTTSSVFGLTVSPARAELTGAPGETVQAVFTLSKPLDKDETYYTSVENFDVQNVTGTPNFKASSTGLSSWIKVVDKIDLKSGEVVKISYSVVIPANADPGPHTSAILFSTVSPTESSQGTTGAKRGMLVLLKVTGQKALQCTILPKSLTRGSENSEVLKLQQFLFDGGYSATKPNGYFGPNTVTAIKRFQASNGMSPVGSVGPLTRAKLKEVSCNASKISKSPSTQPSRLATYKTQAKNDQYENAQKFIKLYVASLKSDDISDESKSTEIRYDNMERRREANAFKDGLQLNKLQEINFARNLVSSDNGLIIYIGANMLYFGGKEDEGALALANIIISGKDKIDLKGRMGYDWAHTLESKEIQKIFSRIYLSMAIHFDEYGLVEQKKIVSILCKERDIKDCKKDILNKETAQKLWNELQDKSTVSVNTEALKTSNVQRTTDVFVLMLAILTYLENNDFKLPISINSAPKETCINPSYSCEGMIEPWLTPNYMKSMPIEPGSTRKNGSGYLISKSNNVVTVSSQYAEGGAVITRSYDYVDQRNVVTTESKTIANNTGINLPPAPDEKINNSTLTGIDGNNNGVRDDIEILLAKKMPNQIAFRNLILYAKQYQKKITDPTPKSRDEALKISADESCIGKKIVSPFYGDAEAVLGADIKGIYENTPQRKKALADFYDVLPGYSANDIAKFPCENL